MKSILHYIKKSNAKFHLKYICPHCPFHKRETRDIKHIGKCYWNHNWKKGKYDSIPFWMGFFNFIRLHILKKPIKICIKNKTYEGAEV